MGGTRFVGKPLVRLMQDAGHSLTLFTRGQQPVPAGVEHLVGDRGTAEGLQVLEGRRFDVYYNDTLVLSQKAMYMPISNISNSSFSGITSGSQGMVGQIALANVYNYRLSSQNVAAKYKEFADTRGRPYVNSTANPVALADEAGLNPSFLSGLTLGSFIPIGSFNLCPAGGCFAPPAVRPASPLYDWSSSYA